MNYPEYEKAFQEVMKKYKSQEHLSVKIKINDKKSRKPHKTAKPLFFKGTNKRVRLEDLK